MTAAVRFEGASKNFGGVKAVDNVDLEIGEGEFFAMLGPSGSGKTTCLRLIAGFEQPTSGVIRIFGEDVRNAPPYRRNVNTVFQDYALFPHLNVADNVAYGLMIKGAPKRERLKAADAALEMVRLSGYGERRPAQLSGGQRQRVALARALINKPKVLLLDEPLGALDLKLREQMQDELRDLQRSLGVTFVFVTHDQGEALSMADRVAVFNEGRVAQAGAPGDVYHRPRSAFVANFVGSSNILNPEQAEALTGTRRPASLRPESIRLAASSGRRAEFLGKNFMGAHVKLALRLDGVRLHALVSHAEGDSLSGPDVMIEWSPAALHFMEDGDA